MKLTEQKLKKIIEQVLNEESTDPRVAVDGSRSYMKIFQNYPKLASFCKEVDPSQWNMPLDQYDNHYGHGEGGCVDVEDDEHFLDGIIEGCGYGRGDVGIIDWYRVRSFNSLSRIQYLQIAFELLRDGFPSWIDRTYDRGVDLEVCQEVTREVINFFELPEFFHVTNNMKNIGSMQQDREIDQQIGSNIRGYMKRR